jgi:acetyl esterase/lipase
MKLLLLSALVMLVGCTSMPEGATVQSLKFSDAHESLIGDLYLPPRLPESKLTTPVVVVVHGGGWTSRTGDMTAISKKLVKSGIAAFNITYRLAPEHLYPKASIDVSQAISWLKDNAREYNIDPARMGGWGYSAGANLILLAGLDPAAGLKAIVAGGTPAKLTYWPKSPMVEEFVGKPLSTGKALWEEASPVNHVKENSPAVFLYHGARDKLVDYEQMDLMKAALQKKNVEVKTHTVALLGHLTVYLLSHESEQLGVSFLKDRL